MIDLATVAGLGTQLTAILLRDLNTAGRPVEPHAATERTSVR